ncbi:GGDEF domain-containing protein [Stutzerimonas azotifigens]|uniref:diguanylate cyclase n=1 Tax=Stutzerimonas azotifigens TaxID=291995 RepID=A0ABR5Z3D6_9GAMM|nr:GGDEF domain-containing protein [Stutzerimonas azotifigens]MBA1274669.1 GGDEF domain-containing protein [Stutzerimonas azotifigens]
MPSPDQTSNTVDFETARKQLLAASQAAKHSKRPLTLADLYRQLNLRLQTSLEIDRLLEMFFTDIQGVLPFAALLYRHEETDLQLTLGSPAAAHTASYRLHYEAEELGEIILQDTQRIDDHRLNQLEALLGCLLFPLRNALTYRRAVQASLRDQLTGAGNRSAMNQALAREIELARRHGHPLSLIMLDLDHFKDLNDSHGHRGGDEALQRVVSRLKRQLRNVDMLFRYGGEEFLVLLSNTDAKDAALVGERLRAAVDQHPFEIDGQPVHLSISLGSATYRAPETLEQLLQRADAALYRAKRSGRNQLSIAL